LRFAAKLTKGIALLPRNTAKENHMSPLSENTALIIIDMQQGFHEIAATGIARNNPSAENNVETLIGAFRNSKKLIFHIRHASNEPTSVFRADKPGYQVMACAREIYGEPVIVKNVNSSFIGTDLEKQLRQSSVDTLVIAGATTNHCVETTTRMAGNLGFRTILVDDATFAFDRTGPDGKVHKAEDIQAMTLSNLNGEFAEISNTADVIRKLVT
jgi:nicotinamidase-related amidase